MPPSPQSGQQTVPKGPTQGFLILECDSRCCSQLLAEIILPENLAPVFHFLELFEGIDVGQRTSL